MTDNNQLRDGARTTGEVTSRDGTRIGYIRVGGSSQNPGLVLLHGSMESAQSHLQLAEALADRFTVYLPDRRGRGMTGPYGPGYGIRTEIDDLDALLTETGAHDVFGVSASGLVALEAARTLPDVHKIAVYEPALLTKPEQSDWLQRFDKQLAKGKLEAAMVTSMKGLTLGPPILNVMPTWLLAALTSLALKAEDRKAAPDDVTMRKLAPTLHYEGVLLREMTGSAETFRTVHAEVLLLGGSKGLRLLKPGLDALEAVLPNARRVEFPGLDHGGSGDASPSNPKGKPTVVAAELRRFFARP